MSESKFLPFQDKNGDGLIDACDEYVSVTPPINCPTCTPDPTASVPDWKKRRIYEPFLNQKICKYQITVRTNEDTTGATSDDNAEAAMEANFDKYVDTAVDALLDVYNKEKASDVVQIVRQAMEYTDYDLDIRPKSRLKLLYSVSSDLIDSLANAEAQISTEEDNTEDVVVLYKAHELSRMLLTVRKTLALYSRYLNVYRKIEAKNIYRTDPEIPFNLQDYGDFGFQPRNSLMGSLLPYLETFLNSKGYKIPYTADATPWSLKGNFSPKEKVEAIEFTFTNQYVLKKLKIFTETCPQEPVEFTNLSAYNLATAVIEPIEPDALSPEASSTQVAAEVSEEPSGALRQLLVNPGWSDPTAMRYLASLKFMETDITARVPMDWVEFLIKYTYPAIFETSDYVEDLGLSPESCVAEALISEGKQLAEDIMGDFSLFDAIAYKYNEKLCKSNIEDVREEDVELGKLMNWQTAEANSPETIGNTVPTGYASEDVSDTKLTLWALAKAQAAQELESDSVTFESICGELLFPDLTGTHSTEQKLKEKLEELKLCGLLDLFAEAIQCLLSGRSLEEGLASIAESALRAMSIDNFGQLFVGLPIEKQEELDALVKQKIENGDIFKESSLNELVADEFAGNYETQKPWEPTSTGTGDSRTLVVSYDSLTDTGLSDDVVIEAYIQAMIEVYGEELFDLIDELNKFPGAQLISNTIAKAVCPTTSLFKPTVFEFIKDVELPYCRNMEDITFPAWNNPFAWIPEWSDFKKILFDSAKEAINELIITALMKIMVKICETLGSATCKAIEGAGTLTAAAFNPATARDQIAAFVREGLCGEDADDETVNAAIADMFSVLGLGAAALADRDNVVSFAEAISSAVTRTELAEAFLCNASDEFLDIVNIIIEYEYPEYREALPTEVAINSFFCNMGNLLPVDFRTDLQDFLNQLPLNDQLPANPSLCATPEQIEDFCAAREELLAGRASPSQIAELCKPEPFIEFPSFEPPPIMSDPGCSNGVFPYEPDDNVTAATAGIGSELESLKVDYSTDMLGNGPLANDWGFMNMILSDTKGQPLTVHYRRAANNDRFVDYYADFEPADITGDDGAATDDPALAFLAGPTPLIAQRAAFPLSVAEWMRSQLSTAADSFSYSSNNEFENDVETVKTFSELGIGILGLGASNFDPLSLPDLGYNISISSSVEDSTVTFIENARKKTPDFTLTFADNAKGKRSGPEADAQESEGMDAQGAAYGFDIEFYLADLYKNAEGDKLNVPHDNTRIKITDMFNPSVLGIDWDIGVIDIILAANPLTGPLKVITYLKKLQEELKDQLTEPFNELAYEFLCVEDTLKDINLDDYPTFLSTFQQKRSYSPQVVLFREMLQQAGSDITRPETENYYNEIMSKFSSGILTAVSENEVAYRYGAQYDDLSSLDVEYGLVGDGITFYDRDTNALVPSGEWIPYNDARIRDSGTNELRTIKNRDMIMGISYMQYQIENLNREEENRVFYLDPSQYGGTYKNPAIYLAPIKNQGWLGFVEVMFPNLSPCKPQSSDLVDFGQIQDMIDDIYPRIPEDERLRYDPDCVVEVPYNRVLTRPSKAAIHGLIVSAIRMYASQSLIKSMATITKFDPRFPQVYSSIYASYIVEIMEKRFKDAQNDWAEFFNPFKDEEFWYAFLEQCVQMYSDLVEQEKVTPPPLVLEALFRLNDMQEVYEENYPTKDTLKEARKTGDAGRLQSFESYKGDKVLEAVKNTEEDAKLIMKELVIRELNYMAPKFIKNLKKLNITPDVHDLNYYLLENHTQGSSLTINENMNADGSIRQEYTNLPTSGDEHYTTGDEFAVAEVTANSTYSRGEEYIGDYHTHINENGELIYMAGAYHTDEPHDVLQPIATEIRVPIGDVAEYNSTVTFNFEKPFAIEKYMLINGTRISTSAGLTRVKSNSADKNISDVFPGTLEFEQDSNGNTIGLTGELGVRLGLAFSVILEDGSSAKKYEVTSVEIDALDISIGKFRGLEGNSKELLCLINHLKTDDKFKLLANYVFPLNKIVATTAIYNEMAFVPSIGEVTVATGESWGGALSSGFEINGKPGTYAEILLDEDGETPIGVSTESGTEAWSSYKDRRRGNPPWLEFDEWDAVDLKNSTVNLKRLFKKHYNFKNFTPDDLFPRIGPGQLYMNRLKGFFTPASLRSLLPRWKRRRLRSNPFNENGELCEKE